MIHTKGGPMKNGTEAQAVIQVSPPAARLKFKGKRLRFTTDGNTWLNYRVVSVSMPDGLGRSTLTLQQIA